jgi:ATP-binding cassette subfamily F protein 3
LIALSDAAVGYGARTVLSGIRMTLAPGDRIGLLGPNGAGKSTLTRLLAGELAPMDGKATRHPYLQVGYFAQHQLEQLDPAASPIEHFRRLDPSAGDQALRNYLGGFQFVGDRAFEPVAPFSGGEKARLALALVVYRKPNLLLLDEPTNHLDLDLRHALELALQDYEGALVLVTHDRHLVEATCDSLWRVALGRVEPFDGDLDDYARWLQAREREYGQSVDRGGGSNTIAADPAAARVSSKDQRRAAADQRAREKPLRDAVKRAEQALAKIERRLAELETTLQDEAWYAAERRAELDGLMQEQATLKQQRGAAEEAWLAASAELEAAQ